MLKLLLICILIIVLAYLIIKLKKNGKIVEGLVCPEECSSQLDSASQLTVLITNLNDKYDNLEKKYGSLQEEIQTNTDNIADINTKYNHANNKLKAEMEASNSEMS